MSDMTNPKKELANREIVTLAVYLLGGDTQYVDTKDIAVKRLRRPLGQHHVARNLVPQLFQQLLPAGPSGRLWDSTGTLARVRIARV